MGRFYTLDFLTDILDYVYQGLNWVAAQTTWLQLVIWVAAVVFILIGFFTFLKKSIKVFFVIAIIAGIIYVLDLQEIIDIQSILDSITGVFGVFGIY